MAIVESVDTVIPVENRETQKYCWVCFATDEDDREAQWVQPCKCRGTSKWVEFSLYVCNMYSY